MTAAFFFPIPHCVDNWVLLYSDYYNIVFKLVEKTGNSFLNKHQACIQAGGYRKKRRKLKLIKAENTFIRL